MTPYTKPALSSFRDKAIKKWVWMVTFMFSNTDGQRKQFQFRGEINKPSSDEDKIKRGNAYVTLLNRYLEEGWNPFDETPGMFERRKTGGFVNRPKTVGECLTECYELKNKQLTSSDAHRTYKFIYEHFTKWLQAQFLDKMRPHEFVAVHAMAYMDQLTNEGKKGRGFNNYRTVMKVFFNMMVDRDVIEKNPFNKTKPAKVTEAEIVPFQDAELKAIREHLKAHDFNLYVFTQFIFYLLLRPIEVIKLQVKHIDLTRGMLTLPAAASKNRKSRSCDIPPPLRSIINDWLKYESINDYLFGKDLQTGSRPISSRNKVTERHKAVLTKLEFEGKLSLYSYKYSGVISAYLAGVSIDEIRRQCGHHSVEITQIYMQKLNLLKPSSFGTVTY